MNLEERKQTGVIPADTTHTRFFGKEISNYSHMTQLPGQHWPQGQTQQQNGFDDATTKSALLRKPSGSMIIEKHRSVIEEEQRKTVIHPSRVHEEPAHVPAALHTPRQAIASQHQTPLKAAIEDSWEFEDARIPQSVALYAKDIYKYLHSHEGQYAAKPGYMSRQPEINEKMRAILIDWLVDVHAKFKLLPETLYLAVSLIDRYCERCTSVTRARYQLVGITALFIASKYEEIYPPELKDFVYVTDNAYTKADVLDMEGQIISVLEFNLLTISPLRFVDRYIRVAKLDHKFLCFTRFILELCLVDYSMLKASPSHLACSAVYLANKLCNKADCNETLLQVANYKDSQVKPLVYDMIYLLTSSESSNLQAVRRKYASPSMSEVSRIRINLLDKRPPPSH
jgi:cyclin B